MIVAYGTAARVARTAVGGRAQMGLRAGLFRPITLWPFPSDALAAIAGRGAGDPRGRAVRGPDGRGRAAGRRGPVPVFFHGRMGGMVPTPDEVLEALRARTAAEGGRSGTRAPQPEASPMTADGAARRRPGP